MKTKKSTPATAIKLIVYGVQGVGKSTFLANAPKPLFLDFERGTGDLDVQVDVMDPAPETWSATLAALEQVATEKHGFESLCIDSLDWLENVCIAHVCAAHKVKSIVDPKVFGYGRGHVCLAEEWRNLTLALQAVINSGINVLCSAHSQIRTYNDPMGASYDRYSMKLTSSKQCDLSGYIQEWAQGVLFCHYDTVVGKVDDRSVGLKGNTRIIHTERQDAFDAKNRWGLPAKMPLDWSAFAKAVKTGTPENPEIITERIKELGAGDENVSGFISHCAGNARKLSQLENYLKNKKAEKTENGTT